MKRAVHRILMIVLLLAFLISTGSILLVKHRYRTSRKKYENAAEQYTDTVDMESRNRSAGDGAAVTAENAVEPGDPPICVDFDLLQKENPDVIGWIFCPGTVINYPVVHARDNEYYLTRDYRGDYDPNGAIFSDEENSPGFGDTNVILYGHHMADMTMFASLEYWLEQDYFDSHPVLWLLTPEQDYRVELFSAYSTTATSETYTVYYQPMEQFNHYLIQVRAWSEVQSNVELKPDAHYVVLSTCAYNYDEGRTVLHGKLVPVNSAGGKEIR